MLTDLTGDPRLGDRVSCHYGNELGELIPFQLIYDSVVIVLAFLEIFCREWGGGEVAEWRSDERDEDDGNDDNEESDEEEEERKGDDYRM